MTQPCMFILVSLIMAECCLADTPSEILEAPSIYKGYFGESHIDDFYVAAGREDILGKWHPNGPGPDRIYRLRDGTIEIHEAKAYRDWPGKSEMNAELGGRQMYELSDAWIDQWALRVLGDPLSAACQKNAVKIVQEARTNGSLVRIYDEISLQTGNWRSSNVFSEGQTNIRLESRSGPIKIERFEQKWHERQARLDKLRLLKQNKVIESVYLNEFPEAPSQWADYEKIGKKQFGDFKVLAGVCTPEGRLIVSISEGAKAGLFVFSIEAGAATYEYLKGDVYKPEYERSLMDAAIKGTSVGGVTAVAVFLGATPSGWVVLGLAVGGYCLTDASLTRWHEVQNRRFVNRDDFAHLGIQVNSVLDINDPNVPLNIDRWKP